MITLSRVTKVSAVIIGFCLLGQQYLLLRTNKSLRTTLEILRQDKIPVGAKLPILVGADIDGKAVEYVMARQTGPTLIFTLASGCPACQKSLDAWGRLSELAKRRGINTVVVSKDWMATAREFLGAGNRVPGILLLNPTYLTHISLQLNATPNAVLVMPTGAIAQVWSGIVDQTKEAEIAKILSAL